MKLIGRLVGDNLEVHQDERFEVEVKSALRSIASTHEWDGGRKTWVFPYSPGSLQGLVDMASMLGAQLALDPVLKDQFGRIQSQTDHETGVRKLIQTYLDDANLPISDYVTQPIPPPWRHQAIAWHWAMRVRCMYLALKPGGGKTRIGADVIRGKYQIGEVRAPEQFALPERPSKALPDRTLPARWCIRGGVLVVCPRVVIGEWVEQLMRWQNIKAIPILGDAPKKRYRAGMKAWVHICAYDSLESVEDNEYDGIIGDELHYIANEDSIRFQRMMALRRQATWVLALSGTPVSNMLPSLWSQYYWLDGGRTLGPSYEAYRKRYFTQEGRTQVQNEGAEVRVGRAMARITMNLTMQQMFPDKAHKVQTVMRIPMTPEQAKYYETLRTKQVADIVSGKVSVGEALTKLIKLLQVTQGFVLDDNKQVQQFSSAKLIALEEMLTGKGDFSDQRVVVWCRFRHDVNVIVAMLNRHKVDHYQLHGDVPDKEREAIKNGWNTNYKKRVLVGMLSMGIGINLHAPNCVDDKQRPARCFTTVFYGVDWRVTQLEQAMDRVYRGDQVETCVYRYLLSDDLDGGDDEPLKPIDVRIYECLQDKLDQATEINEEGVDYIRRLLGVG
jgi:superfamily II DNA or RNA helicase